jgi:hypothetical protein
MIFVILRVFETSPEGIHLGVVDIKLSKLLLIKYYLTASQGEILICHPKNGLAPILGNIG